MSTAAAGETTVAADARPERPNRVLPQFRRRAPLRRAFSFVTVAFCDELRHNLLASPCVHDPRNELVVVDNAANLHFDTLSAAWQHGIDQARHDLIALVHEDVLLLPEWQASLEACLDALEAEDPQWGLIGVAGWDADGAMCGCWNDPRGDSVQLGGRPFAPVLRIDEHFMLMHRARGIRLDAALPSIHGIGSDLALQARARELRTYVVDAPTVHKFADARGVPILGTQDSPKIVARNSLTYLADHACSMRYLERKWQAGPDSGSSDGASGAEHPVTWPASDAPVLLLARGGGGSRLLAFLAADAGVHIGNDLNPSGDAMELAQPLYQWLLARYRYPAADLADTMRRHVLDAVSGMRQRAHHARPWGFKLPESMLMADALLDAFPAARVAHLVRDPLSSCLRRSHMTARTDNQVGQASLLAAYRARGLGAADILAEPPAMHMARTTRHQIEAVCATLATLPPERVLRLRYEDLLRDPEAQLARFRAWLGPDAPNMPGAAQPERLRQEIDPERPLRSTLRFDPAVESAVAAEVQALRIRLGYGDA